MRRRIDEQLTRLQDNDRLRRELIGNISHDLHRSSRPTAIHFPFKWKVAGT